MMHVLVILTFCVNTLAFITSFTTINLFLAIFFSNATEQNFMIQGRTAVKINEKGKKKQINYFNLITLLA